MSTRKIGFLLATLLLCIQLAAQAPIRYEVELDQIEHHEVRIRVDFPALSQQTLRIRMPQSSPGRYAAHNFAKNVYQVQAFNSKGKPLKVYRSDTHEWEVGGHDGAIRFEYTLYGNRADGTYSGIDNRKVHLNMPASFVYGVGMPQHPIELRFDLSKHPDWSVATQLKALPGGVYYAPNYYYFYDSPTIAGEFDFRRWNTASNGKEQTIELAMLHEGTDEELDRYAEWVKRIVEEQKAVFGELPTFDYGRYTFLCSYNPWVNGDGMEHRNSTICSSKGDLATAAQGLVGTVSHEFFHAWNVERLRPRSLEPFDFDRANPSEALWFAEGFTSYYGDLILVRAGILSPEEYVQSLSGLLNYVLFSPGRAIHSPIEMSLQAPFVDAATSIDETNQPNTFISYYSYGAVLALCLDLELRSRYTDLSLDSFMQRLWEKFGRSEIPYTIPDLQQTLGELCRDTAFAGTFFRESIYGSELPDISKLLEKMGIVSQQKDTKAASFLNLRFNFTPGGAVVAGRVLKNNPLYAAGLSGGETLLEIDGRKIESAEVFKAISEKLRPGKRYSLRYLQRGKEKTGEFTAAADPSLEVFLMEKVERKPSAEQLARRRDWLGG